MARQSLEQIVRSLDQSDTQQLPEKLSQIWNILCGSAGVSNYANEEVLLRSLLKHMHGTSSDAELFRRLPLTWSILACTFQRIPLGTLAKCLADRKFIATLTETAKHISKPQKGEVEPTDESSDTVMADAPAEGGSSKQRKRKRTKDIMLNLDSLRRSDGCLRSAESLFAALRTLLSRLESHFKATSREDENGIGIGHLRSLFSNPTSETLGFVAPLVRTCAVSLAGDNAEILDGQPTWLSTIAAIWELHLKSPTDAADFAINIAPTALIMLGRLRGIPKSWNLSIDGEVRDAWTGALERLLVGNVIRPAKTSFMNRRDAQVLIAAVGDSPANAGTRSAVLFELALNDSETTTQASTRRGYEEWVQRAFDIIEEPLRALEPKERSQVVTFVLRSATDRGISPSLNSLRSLCDRYALQGDVTDWELISYIAQCDTDTFLVGTSGAELLDTVLKRIVAPAVDSHEAIHEFLDALARGFASSRDLSGFVKKWFDGLTRTVSGTRDVRLDTQVWCCRRLRKTVADLLQPSLTSQQLIALLDWIEAQEEPSGEVARLVIYDTIASGLQGEDFIDAIGARLFEGTFSTTSTSKSADLAALRWRVARKTLAWLEIDEVRTVWKEIKKPLKKGLAKSNVAEPEAFEAFRCALAALDELKYKAKDEDAARGMVSDFLARLNADMVVSDHHNPTRPTNSLDGPDDVLEIGFTGAPNDYLQAILNGSSSLVGSIAKAEKDNTGPIFSLLGAIEKTSTTQDDLIYEGKAVKVLLSKLDTEHNQALIDRAVNIFVEVLSEDHGYGGLKSAKVKNSVKLLLSLPPHLITREVREQIMRGLLSLSTSTEARPEDPLAVSDWMPVLSLMARVMQDPTFYEDMKFKDLASLGESVEESLQQSPLSDSVEAMLLLKEIAQLTIRQMLMTIDKREIEYFRGLTKILSKWIKKSSSQPLSRTVLLNSTFSAVLNASASRETIQEYIDVAKVKEQLANLIADALHRFKKRANPSEFQGDDDAQLLPVLVALDSSWPHNELIAESRLRKDLSELEVASGDMCSRGLKTGWLLKTFLVEYFGDKLKDDEMTDLSKIFMHSELGNATAAVDNLPVYAPLDLVQQYVAATTRTKSDQSKLLYLKNMISKTGQQSQSIGELVAIGQLLKQVPSNAALPSEEDAFDLAAAQSLLFQNLETTGSAAEFSLIVQIIVTLLSESASSMSQWNVDGLLYAVCTVSDNSYKGKGGLEIAPNIHAGLSRLVDTVIKRHRLRLEGHLHLLAIMLESLLRSLITGLNKNAQSAAKTGARTTGSQVQWTDSARQYSRLLELVCEPTVASVTRSQKPKLDSATDAAKRSAGRYMYTVLEAYIKLQLEQNVPHQIREALEPGVFSVLSITSEQTRKVMNDAMDPSGRAIFREMYKRWQRFGKWKGV